MDKSLNRGMFNKFESRQICVAGYQFSGVTVNVLVFVAELSRAHSGAPWVRKFGKLSIRENLVMT